MSNFQKLSNGTLSGTQVQATDINFNSIFKNYILYNNFENNATTGWSLGTIGTLTNGLPTGTPTFGSGSSGNLSIATTSSSIEGSYSLNYISSAATTQGDMLASQSYAIDAEDQAKVLTIKFYYSVPSGASNCNFSGTNSNSFAWAIWDVTNSSWLTSAGNFNLVQKSGSGYVTGTCQTNSNTANIRLVIYNANATSGAATLTLDSFYVGPQTAPSGPAMGDWVAYTPTFVGFGTVSSVSFVSRRVGDTLQVKGVFVSGISTATQAQITMGFNGANANVTVDSSKITSQNAGGYWNNASNNVTGEVYINGSTDYITFAGSTNGTSAAFNGGSMAISGNPIYVFFSAPIAGWSSNSVMSSDTDTRVCAAGYDTPSSTTLTSGSPINFTNLEFDTHGAVTTGSSWAFTAPISGYYQVDCHFTSLNSSSADIIVYKNGSLLKVICVVLTTNSMGGNCVIQLNAGDYIDLRSDITVTLANTSGDFNYIQIFRLSGPAVVQATESVNASYYVSGSSYSISGIVNFDTKIFDSHNVTTTGSNWRYTAPVSGKYRIEITTLTSSASGYSAIYKNGSAYARIIDFNYIVSGTDTGSVSLPLNAGDYINFQTSANDTFIGGSVPYSTYICIERIGN